MMVLALLCFTCRADEWDVNKWAWEGVLKVISKGEECIIRLEDKSTGKLYISAVFVVDSYPLFAN